MPAPLAVLEGATLQPERATKERRMAATTEVLIIGRRMFFTGMRQK
jgi:hypothetical protein